MRADPRSAMLLPLRHVAIDATVLGGSARLTVTQHYRNDSPVPVELVYTFPLDGDTAVCGFRARLGDRSVEGIVEARDEAFARYDEAMARGHTAALLDQERPDIFTASLGNLRAGEDAELEVRVIQDLQAEGGAWRFTIPTTMGARYFPARHQMENPRDVAAITPPMADKVPYGVSLAVRVQDTGARVQSPSHAITTVQQDGGLLVTLASEVEAMDRDIVLLVSSASEQDTVAWSEASTDGEHFVAMDVRVPEDTAAPEPRDVVFVVDCSGSMQGPSIDEARRAMALCVRALLPGDRFQVIRFGSRAMPLFAGLVPYDGTSFERALDAITGMQADLGGTEMTSALMLALQARTEGAADGRGRMELLLLTDGQVGNEAELIALAGAHADRARISTFGIGMAAASALVRELARVTRGRAEQVHPGERIEGKVLRTFGAIRSRMLSFAVEGAEDTASPVPGEVVPGETLRLAWRANHHPAAQLNMHLGDRRVAVPVAEWRGAPQVAVRWARHRIRSLETGAGRTGSRQQRGQGDAVERELVALGRRYGVVSSATSLVLVVRRVDDAGQPGSELYRVPVQRPGARRSMMSAGASMVCASPMPAGMSAPMSAPPDRSVAGSAPSSPPSASPRSGESMRLPFPNQPARRSTGTGGSPDNQDDIENLLIPTFIKRAMSDDVRGGDRLLDRLLALLATQSLDGQFPWSDALEAALTEAPELGDQADQADPLATTRVVLALFRRVWREFRMEWMAAARKAEGYLEGVKRRGR